MTVRFRRVLPSLWIFSVHKMKNRKLFLLMAVSFIFVAFSAVVNAYAEESAFDYSAEKMDCRITPPVINTEEADRNRDLLGAVSELDWSIGPENAILTIIEYADFQCPYCADTSLSLIKYQQKHSDDVRLVYRHFPLSFHEKAVPAALAANAAGYQGMFFEAEEFLFEKQAEWSVLESNDAFTEWLIQEFSQFSDLDFDLWYLAFSDSDNETVVRNMYSQVIKAGIVSGTPTVFLNYTDSNYMFDNASLDSFVEKIRIDESRTSECPDVVIEEGRSYTAILETDAGDIHIELFPETAPNAVNSFKFQAKSGLFDGTEIRSGYNGFEISFGDMASPGYSFDAEFDDSRLFDGPGYFGISFTDGQTFGRIFITNDVHAVYEMQIRHDCPGTDISDETIGQYVLEKIIRFSKSNTVFGKIADEDMDKLEQLNKGTVINKIRFQ